MDSHSTAASRSTSTTPGVARVTGSGKRGLQARKAGLSRNNSGLSTPGSWRSTGRSMAEEPPAAISSRRRTPTRARSNDSAVSADNNSLSARAARKMRQGAASQRNVTTTTISSVPSAAVPDTIPTTRAGLCRNLSVPREKFPTQRPTSGTHSSHQRRTARMEEKGEEKEEIETQEQVQGRLFPCRGHLWMRAHQSAYKIKTDPVRI